MTDKQRQAAETWLKQAIGLVVVCIGAGWSAQVAVSGAVKSANEPQQRALAEITEQIKALDQRLQGTETRTTIEAAKVWSAIETNTRNIDIRASDRWEASRMDAWVIRLKLHNPQLRVPDPREMTRMIDGAAND